MTDILTGITADELPLFWRGRGQALRLLDKEFPDRGTRARAEVYEECANELRAALNQEDGNAAEGPPSAEGGQWG